MACHIVMLCPVLCVIHMTFLMSITPEDELCHYCHLVDSHERVRGRGEMDTHHLWQCTNKYTPRSCYILQNNLGRLHLPWKVERSESVLGSNRGTETSKWEFEEWEMMTCFSLYLFCSPNGRSPNSLKKKVNALGGHLDNVPTQLFSMRVNTHSSGAHWMRKTTLQKRLC